MNTNTDLYRSESDHASSHVSAPARKGKGRLIAGMTAAGIGVAAVCGAAAFAFGSSSSHAAVTPIPTSSGTGTQTPSNAGTQTPSNANNGSQLPNTGSHTANNAGHHTSGGGSVVKPSAGIMQLQRDLGMLDFYEGPVDGFDGPQTTAAITYLQRAANLPQTGVMNQATRTAMAKMLVQGPNQMGVN